MSEVFFGYLAKDALEILGYNAVKVFGKEEMTKKKNRKKRIIQVVTMTTSIMEAIETHKAIVYIKSEKN